MTLDERVLSLTVVGLGVAVLGLAVWVALLQRSEATLRRRLRRVIPGGETGLDEILDAQVQQAASLSGRVDALVRLQQELDTALQRSIQRVGVVRFNPFPDTGGDQSFAIALLDKIGNGLVISSLHSRADTRVFAKQIANGRSRYPLSDEEQDAIKAALGT
ncbi:MAG TPA: DUF4446 family protein [Candidatus Limnocylindria bacterium]|jgi:hypothetical protein